MDDILTVPEKPTLILLVGLPYSGKSRHARHLSETMEIPIVSPDAIRLATHGFRFLAEQEDVVWLRVRALVGDFFDAGHRAVILDATNTTRERRDEWEDPRWTRSFVTFDTPIDVCVDRAIAANDHQIIPVIERMAAQFEPVTPEESQDAPD